MAKKRLFTIAVAREAQVGVAASTIYDAASANLLVSDPQMSADNTTFDREVNKASFTALTKTVGISEGTCSFTTEMSGVNAGAPPWGLLLEACGFRQRALTRVALNSAIAGNGTPNVPLFFSGEIVGDTTETGEVVHDTWDGSTNLYLADPSGSFGAAATITGVTSESTATSHGTPANEACGYAWTPVSIPEATLTTTATLVGSTIPAKTILIGVDSGAVVETQEAVDGAGSFLFRILDGTLAAGEELSNDGTDTGSSRITLDSGASFQVMSAIPSVTLALYEDGVIKTMRGCRGKVTFVYELGQTVKMNFEFRGIPNAPIDGTLPDGAIASLLVPPTFIGVDLTMGRDSIVTIGTEHVPCVRTLNVSYDTTTATLKCATSATGVDGGAEITARAVTGSIDPTVRPEATFPWVNMFRTGEVARLGLTVGTVPGNTFRQSLPALFFEGEGAGDVDGNATRDMSFSASGRTPDGVDRDEREFVLSYHTTAFVK